MTSQLRDISPGGTIVTRAKLSVTCLECLMRKIWKYLSMHVQLSRRRTLNAPNTCKILGNLEVHFINLGFGQFVFLKMHKLSGLHNYSIYVYR